MSRQFPSDVGTLNALGDAQRRSDQKREAKVTFARVVAIAPSNSYAAFNLFDVQLELDEPDDAERTLALLRTHHAGPWADQRQIALAIRRGEKTSAQRLLGQVLAAGQAGRGALELAVKEMDGAGWTPLVDELLSEWSKSKHGAANDDLVALAEIWAKRAGEAKHLRRCQRILRTLRGHQQAWLAAVVPYVNALATAKRASTLRWLRWRHRALLKSDTRAWGAVVT